MNYLRDAQASAPLGCDELRERHGDYVDGVVAADVQARIEAHLAGCSRCTRYDRVVRQGLQLVRELPQLAPSDDFEQRLQHRIFHVQDGAALAHDRPFSGVAVAAAVAGIIALVAWSPLLLSTTDRVASDTLPVEPSATMSRVASAGTQMDAPALVVPLTPADPLGGALDDWFAGQMTAPTSSTAAYPLVFPGPYSPLIVQPPVHGGAVRMISTEYRAVE